MWLLVLKAVHATLTRPRCRPLRGECAFSARRSSLLASSSRSLGTPTHNARINGDRSRGNKAQTRVTWCFGPPRSCVKAFCGNIGGLTAGIDTPCIWASFVLSGRLEGTAIAGGPQVPSVGVTSFDLVLSDRS